MPRRVKYPNLPIVTLTIESPRGEPHLITGPDDAAAALRPLFTDIVLRERLIALYLNHAGRVLGAYTVSVGTANASIADPRSVFQAAILSNASSVILAHNHPSNVLEASREDRDMTRQLVSAGVIIGIPVQDHIILTSDKGFTSFAQEGWL